MLQAAVHVKFIGNVLSLIHGPSHMNNTSLGMIWKKRFNQLWLNECNIGH